MAEPPTEATTAPYGTWRSPITAEHLAGDSIQFEGIATDKHGRIFVLESRPSEGGRHAIVELTGPACSKDVLPAEYNAMGTIHEYGGGSMAIHPEGGILFTSHPSNGVCHLLDPSSGKVDVVVAPDPAVRFGEFSVCPTATHAWILAVRETHLPENVKEREGVDGVENTVVAIHALTGNVSTILQGADFYEHPQFSPDGKRLCWTQWNHPDMPWSGTELYVAEWDSTAGAVLQRRLVSGKAGVESICQPRWGVDGTLFYVSDKSGYWQLYRFDGETSAHVSLAGLETAEFGSREPCLGNCTYIQLDDNTLVASATLNATSNLVSIDLATNGWTDLALPLVDIQKNALARISSSSFAVLGSTRTLPQACYRVDLHGEAEGKSATLSLLKATVHHLDLAASVLSQAQHITFPQIYGRRKHANGSAHAWFVPPKNTRYTAPPDTKPPLLVWMHGGPTYHVPPGLALSTQYWTSRGYAYVLVNHVGSTGYGRAYRDLLNGNWGAADIDDAASCVSYLAEEGLIDVRRVGIVGESAGGYAVMQALYLHPDVWTAGVALYGISSLAEFVEGTHKFESRYVESLVLGTREGRTEEEVAALFRERSALYHTEKIKAPLLLLQGDSDTIVPAWQTTRMAEAMQALGQDVEVTIFEGEGHGFVMDKTIKACLELQAAFWARTLL
ncbi:hypothetical protein SCUCBS95973_002122 [Sporothrix curviconia]|uniref:Peptidase S9 prolyl oligopeptidase catalytic domain-containing protein n=1 Tax=Sporothrix curviconia TaxID=1260050 RepID=A0ABP0B440_9PEZI